jgi:hypothetical protein
MSKSTIVAISQKRRRLLNSLAMLKVQVAYIERALENIEYLQGIFTSRPPSKLNKKKQVKRKRRPT